MTRLACIGEELGLRTDDSFMGVDEGTILAMNLEVGVFLRIEHADRHWRR